ncbi:MAG TPA: selenium cofactor biosynthesis protein YqeC [bacterium]
MPFYQLIHDDLSKIKGQIVSFIGGGGKSSLLQTIGKELALQNLRVVLTSTTKFQPFPQIGLVLVKDGRSYLSELKTLLDEIKVVQVAGDYHKKDRFLGVSVVTVQELSRLADVVLIEADGCRQRSLKTHRENEPVIPSFSTTIVIICGCDVVGEPLNAETVHRAQLFSEKWHLPLNEILTPEIISKELLSPKSYLRNVPIRAAIRLFISKADSNPIGGKLLSEHLLRKTEYPIFLGSIQRNQLQRVVIENLRAQVRFE